MGDSQSQGTKKGPYQQWTARKTKSLIKLLTEGIKNGWRDASGCISKMIVEKKFTRFKFGASVRKNYNHYTNKMKNLKSRYNNMVELTRFSSGFGWDPISKKFTAPNHVWEDYEKAHPNKKNMRDETFEEYEDLQTIFHVGLVTGRNVVGLGDQTDAQSFEVEDNSPSDLYTRAFGNIENMDESPPLSQEKLLPKKQSKSRELGVSSNLIMDSSGLQKSFIDMVEVSNRIVDLMQQREKRPQQLLEAFQEIPNLEENVLYNGLEEINRLEMSELFINMSIEQRLDWIRRKKN